MEHPICLTCAYFRPGQPADRGHCQRRSIDASTQRWPSVYPDEWCGEHSEFAEYLEARFQQRLRQIEAALLTPPWEPLPQAKA